MMRNTYSALVGATIYPSPDDVPILDSVVLIHSGTIAAVGPHTAVSIPPDATILNCAGSTLLAGFWNSHVHFFERKWANAAAVPAEELERELQETFGRYGFTTVFDLGSTWENTTTLRKRIKNGDVAGPSILTTGEAILPPKALPGEEVLRAIGVMPLDAPEATSPEEAATAARRILERGADGIKLFASAPRGLPLSEDILSAAVTEARRRHKPVFVHPNSGADVLTAVRSGIDVIAHTTPASGPWDADTLSLMRDRGVALTPTLTLWREFLRHDRLSLREQLLTTALEQLSSWRGRGGAVLFGTDLGATNSDPADEYRLMVMAGLSFREILASLTTAPARRFDAAQRVGRVATGFDADLVLLGGDPAHEINALTNVRLTIQRGRITYSAASSARTV